MSKEQTVGRAGKSPRQTGTIVCVQPEPPRLLLASNFLSASGRRNQTTLEELAQRLQVRGYQLICASRHLNGLVRGADLVTTALVRRTDYDVAIVCLFSGRAFLWGEALCLLLRGLHRPVILWLHGGALPQFAQRFPKRVHRVLQAANLVVAPSAYLQQSLGQYRNDLIVLPNALQISMYPFRIRAAPRPELVWLRAFHQIYNPGLAVRVLSGLRRAGVGARLTMVGHDKGDGSLRETCRLAAELAVEDHVRIVKGVSKSDVPGILQSGDVFLNTTNVDNTPVSVLEAMACGLCVVTTDAGGIPYLACHNRDSLIVPAGNAEAMTEAVLYILRQPGLGASLSRNARAKVEKLDWSELLPHWEELIARVSARPH